MLNPYVIRRHLGLQTRQRVGASQKGSGRLVERGRSREGGEELTSPNPLLFAHPRWWLIKM